MKKNNSSTHSLSGVSALLLFGIFAACIVLVLLSGAKLYRAMTQRDRASADARTAVEYIATRVRQAASPDSLSVTSFGGSDCLEMTERIDGDSYRTRLYCADGWLWELFSADGGSISPEDGTRILEADSMSLTLQGDLLSCVLTDPDGVEHRLLLSIRGSEEVGE